MVALAGTASAQAFDGLYAGATAGHNSTDIKVSENWTPSTYDSFGASGGEIGVFAGYGQEVAPSIYMGGEIEANKSNAEFKYSTSTDTLKVSKEHAYGVAVRAGYAAGNVMPYVRVGYNKAKFKGELSGTLTGSETESKGGLAFGAGMQWKATDMFSLRGEFVRTNYGKITDTDGTNTITYDPTENVARVGVSVHF